MKKGRNDIKTLEGFKGKKIMSAVGSNYNKILTDYDKNREFKISYYDGNISIALDEITSGKADATLHDRLTVGFL